MLAKVKNADWQDWYIFLCYCSEELSEAKMTHNTYVHLCNDYRQQLQDNEQELHILQVCLYLKFLINLGNIVDIL